MRLLPFLSTVVLQVAVFTACSDTTAPDPQSPAAPDPGVLSLSVIPSAAIVDGGKLLKLTAKLHHSDGTYSQPAGVTWSSGDGTIATVNGAGLVQALRAGSTQIVASYQQSRASSVVTVMDPVIKKPLGCLAPLRSGSSRPHDSTCA